MANPPTRLLEHSNLRHRIVIGLPVTYFNVEYGQSSIARSLPRRCSQEPGHRPAGAVLRVNPIHQGMNACGASVKRARLPLHLDPERIAPGVELIHAMRVRIPNTLLPEPDSVTPDPPSPSTPHPPPHLPPS